MSIFFISDLHLEEKKPHLTEAFKTLSIQNLAPKMNYSFSVISLNNGLVMIMKIILLKV